jgi:hypothetical protein
MCIAPLGGQRHGQHARISPSMLTQCRAHHGRCRWRACGGHGAAMRVWMVLPRNRAFAHPTTDRRTRVPGAGTVIASRVAFVAILRRVPRADSPVRISDAML